MVRIDGPLEHDEALASLANLEQAIAIYRRLDAELPGAFSRNLQMPHGLRAELLQMLGGDSNSGP